MRNQKTINMDACRLLAAFMIVAIHTYPLEKINPNLDYFFTRIIFRIAVPFFLMVTGYFLIPKILKNKSALIGYSKKILKLYVISIIIYLPVNIYMGYFNHTNILNITKDIFFNGTFYHLWYFPALLLGLWISYVFPIKGNKKNIFFIFILLFLIGIFGDSYYGTISKITILKNFYHILFCLFDYTRNGFFYTPIFLYIGYIISCTDRVFSEKKRLLFLFSSLALMGVEGMILYYFQIPRHTSMYFFLVPTAYFLFSFLREKEWKRNKNICNIATWLYILHPLFIIVIRFIFKIIHAENIIENSIVNYLIVVLSTVIFTYIIENMIKPKILLITSRIRDFKMKVKGA